MRRDMAKMKSTKMSANNRVYQLVKNNINDSYFLEVLYFHIRKALSMKDFNLGDVETLRISGKYLGYDIEVDLDYKFNSIIRSLNLALSLRALILDKSYIASVLDDKLLFGTIDSNFLSWNSHRAILECLQDDDFSFIYTMIVNYKDYRSIPDEQKTAFREMSIDPGYHHQEEFCKKLAGREDYHGRTVIKNNAFLYSSEERLVVNKVVEYVGNTAFAYCANLKEILFEGKVIFGKFPIIECDKLRRIIVPTDLIDYYKTQLPYYKKIITDKDDDTIDSVASEVREEVAQEPILEEKSQQSPLENTDIEVVYVDVPSADPYTEIEVPVQETTQAEVHEEEKEPIDVKTLDKVFDKVASSYKFFWMMAIISLAREKHHLALSFNDITIRMAAMAWPIVFEDDIDLGHCDIMKSYLEGVVKKTKLIKGATSNVVENYLKQHYTSQGVDKILSPLMKNVPYRFLSPWIKYTTDAEVIEKSCSSEFNGLYAIHSDYIVLDEEWWEYIDSHYLEVCDFAMRSFITYAKKYNSDMKLVKLMTTGWQLIK